MPAHGSRGMWPRDVLKKVSRGLSRVEAGNPGFPRLVQVTSGGSEYSLEGLMLKLKLQYFGQLMQRANSLEKTLIWGKIEGKRRRGDRG